MKRWYSKHMWHFLFFFSLFFLRRYTPSKVNFRSERPSLITVNDTKHHFTPAVLLCFQKRFSFLPHVFLLLFGRRACLYILTAVIKLSAAISSFAITLRLFLYSFFSALTSRECSNPNRIQSNRFREKEKGKKFSSFFFLCGSRKGKDSFTQVATSTSFTNIISQTVCPWREMTFYLCLLRWRKIRVVERRKMLLTRISITCLNYSSSAIHRWEKLPS